MSDCEMGVKSHFTAGIYTFHNGTTTENATVGDISADLLELEREDPPERMGTWFWDFHFELNAILN